jgi:AbrB family looped-hinge helix DNA binding protein
MGKRGTVVVPAKVRERYRMSEGAPLLIEERPEGLLLRPAVTTPVESELYTPERLAEFFLNNALSADGYKAARKEVEAMGLNPDTIDHIHWPKRA